MASDDFYKSLKAIDVIEAQEMLLQMTVQDYPNMKKEDRNKLHRKISKASDPFLEERAIKADDLKGFFDISKLNLKGK